MCRPKKSYSTDKSSERSSKNSKNQRTEIPTINGDGNVEVLSYRKLPENESKSGSWQARITEILSDTESEESGTLFLSFFIYLWMLQMTRIRRIKTPAKISQSWWIMRLITKVRSHKKLLLKVTYQISSRREHWTNGSISVISSIKKALKIMRLKLTSQMTPGFKLVVPQSWRREISDSRGNRWTCQICRTKKSIVV